MNSFRLTAVGNLASNPQLDVNGTGAFARFCLIGQDDAAEDHDPSQGSSSRREAITKIWFIAFGSMATGIARQARKGAQLFLEARVITNSWVERRERLRGHTFVVTGYRFGARRGGNTPPVDSRSAKPPGEPNGDATSVELDPFPPSVEAVAAEL